MKVTVKDYDTLTPVEQLKKLKPGEAMLSTPTLMNYITIINRWTEQTLFVSRKTDRG